MGVQWYIYGEVSETHRLTALNRIKLLNKLRTAKGWRALRKIWSDGICDYEVYLTDRVTRIRITSGGVAAPRFWVLADDNTAGAPAGSQAFYALSTDGTGVWKAEVVLDEYRLTYPGAYHWSSADGSIRLRQLDLEASYPVAQSCFSWQWNNFVPSYCRFGGLNRMTYKPTSDPEVIISKTEPLMVDAVDHVNRETRTVPTYSPTTWGYQAADGPFPYPDITHVSPERSTHDMLSYATNPNDYWDTLAGVDIDSTVNGVGSRYDFPWLYNYEGVMKYMFDLQTIAGLAWFYDVDTTVPGMSTSASTSYPITHTPAFSWPAHVGSATHNQFFVSASNDGLNVLFAVRGSTTSKTGIFVELTIDHATATATLAEKNPEYSEDITTVTVIDIDDGPGGNFDGSKTATAVEHIYGYGYDESGVLKEVEIRKTTVDTQVVKHTYDFIHSPDPPNDPPEIGDYGEAQTRHDDSRTIAYLIEVLIDSVVVVTKTFTPTTITYSYSSDVRNTWNGTGTDETTTESTAETRTEVDMPEVILHSLETLTDSVSISIIEGVNVYNAANTAFDRTVADTETTRVRDALVDTTTYTATSTAVSGVGVIPIAPGGYSLWSAGTITTTQDYESTNTVSDFPRTYQNVRCFSSGSLRRFLRDHEGNVLTYCPTGQEAYWNTSKVSKLGTHDETTPPTKWRLDGMPCVFGIYDNTGIEVDLTALNLTNIEAIGMYPN